MLWHEHMSRRNIDNSEALQVRPALTPSYLAPPFLYLPATVLSVNFSQSSGTQSTLTSNGECTRSRCSRLF